MKTIPRRRTHTASSRQIAIESLEARTLLSATLNTNFGTDGYVELGNLAREGGIDDHPDVLALPDGKIITFTQTPAISGAWVLQRFLPNGDVDTSFGTNGAVTTQFLDDNDNPATWAAPSTLLLREDGKILAVGSIARGRTSWGAALYHADGTLDTTFGDGGTIETYTEHVSRNRAYDAVLLPGGRFAIAGDASFGLDGWDMAIVMFRKNGELDLTFGAQGIAKVDLGLDGSDFEIRTLAHNLAVAPDGKLLLAGRVESTNLPGQVVVARLNPNGSLDTTFNGTGRQVITFDANGKAADHPLVTVQPDGKPLVVAHYSFNGASGSDLGVARLNVDGSLDNTYGTNGIVILNPVLEFDRFTAHDLELQVDNSMGAQPGDVNLVIAGAATQNLAYHHALFRVDSHGAPDGSFGPGGAAIFPELAGVGFEEIFASDVTPNGDLVGIGGWFTEVRLGQFTVSGQFVGTPPKPNAQLLAFNNTTGQWNVGTSTGNEFVQHTSQNWSAGQNWTFLEGDFNGDGLIDVAGRNDAGQWWVALNASEAVSTQYFGAWSTATTWVDFLVGDFNGDGRDDIAGRTNTGQWWIGQSNGTRFIQHYGGQWAPTGWQEVHLGDFNGDGRDDIAGMQSSGQWWHSISNGQSFTTRYVGRWSGSADWRDINVGDFNGDGRDDIIGRTAFGEWWIAQSTLTTILSWYGGRWNNAANWTDVSVGDFNGDGMDDVAGRNAAGQWWINRSTGGGMQTGYWGAWSSAIQWTIVIGDFNGDGFTDVSGFNAANGAWYTLLSNGSQFQNNFFGYWSGLTDPGFLGGTGN